jgi:hypothetical protein
MGRFVLSIDFVCIYSIPRGISPSRTSNLVVVLGQGGQWAPVTGFDGTMTENHIRGATDNIPDDDVEEAFSPELSLRKRATVPIQFPRQSSDSETNVPVPLPRQNSDSETAIEDEPIISERPQPSSTIGAALTDTSTHPAIIGSSDFKTRPYPQAHVYVGKRHGDGIFVDDPAFLAEWSVDAMNLIRRHLLRAGNGKVPIPGLSNWPQSAADTEDAVSQLPLWADYVADSPSRGLKPEDSPALPARNDASITITDLPLMVTEVCDLLDVMEDMMDIQRRRRLDLLRPPSWIRCNWYVVAAVAPPIAFVVGRLVTKGYGKQVVTLFAQKVTDFFRERVVNPVVSM